MKRPHSAKFAKNYFAQSQEDPTITQDPSFPFSRPKKIANVMSLSNDLTRMLPKRIQKDKEHLYCQTLQLKNSLNEMTEENLRLRTKIATIQKERDRLNKVDEPLTNKGKGSNVNLSVKVEKENVIVGNLKKMVRESRNENDQLRTELEKLKKIIRFTKINQIETERKTVFQENKRLAYVIQQMEVELMNRIKQEDQVRKLEQQLEHKTTELKEVTQDNIKYEQILEQVQMRHREAVEKLANQERKWQRDITIEKRKTQQHSREVQILNQQIKMLRDQLRQASHKNQTKNTTRPVSSRPQRAQSNNLKNKNLKQKAQALEFNQKLKRELQQAKKKLIESQNKLQKAQKASKDKLQSKDKTFELELTNNQFINDGVGVDYKDDFQGQDSVNKNYVNQLPIEQKSKNKAQQRNRIQQKKGQTIIDKIRQILTFRMKYNRYTFSQLKNDIEMAPLHTFTYEDLINMLTSQPFYLSKSQAKEFLKVCYGKDRINNNQTLQSSQLLKYLRKAIDDFIAVDQQYEEKILYKIAETITQFRELLKKEFSKTQGKKTGLKKEQVNVILKKIANLTDEEVDLVICYISNETESFDSINYSLLLDKFHLNNVHPSGHGAEDLSLGENEDLDEGELIADDELV